MTLQSLHIKNVVLIEQLDLVFGAGLTALTGETGAGKSILLDALSLAAGARADTGLIRKGQESASVTATFEVDKTHSIYQVFHKYEFTAEAGEAVILRRQLSADGKSKAFINDIPVSVALLKEAGEALVDIHGQFETYGLLNPATHKDVLDEFAANAPLLAACASGYEELQQARSQLQKLESEAEKIRRNEAYLKAAYEELLQLNPQAGEEEDLVEKKARLQNREVIANTLNSAAAALSDEEGAEMRVAAVWKNISRLTDKLGEEKTTPLLNALDAAAENLQQAARLLDALMNEDDLGGLSLEAVEDRLYGLRAAARKHNCLPVQLPEILQGLEAEVTQSYNLDKDLANAAVQLETARKNFLAAAQKLSVARLKAAKILEKAVMQELPPLKLEKARIEVKVQAEVEAENKWNAKGFDSVQLLVATNQGTEAGPLNKVASGGEMARFMLALKVILAEKSAHKMTFIFDEIDTGVGGATASAIGERLARLGHQHQVMVVTHSPQVAASAGAHLIVAKDGIKTNIIPLHEKTARREEIARMLSGEVITEEARAAADSLLKAGKI